MTAEIPQEPGRVPVGELRELVAEWRESSEYDAENGFDAAAGTWGVVAKELEEVIDRYD